MVSRPLLARKNQILKGYVAFNDGDRAILEGPLCEDVVWHLMDGSGTIDGRDAVLGYLDDLRKQGTMAELFGVASHENVSITLDFTSGGPEGDHACADRIAFDESGCIKEIWHCLARSHHPPDHDHASSA